MENLLSCSLQELIFPAGNAQGKWIAYLNKKENGCFLQRHKLISQSENHSGWTAPQLEKQRVVSCLSI